jgi:hypothetical protein
MPHHRVEPGCARLHRRRRPGQGQVGQHGDPQRSAVVVAAVAS